MERFASPARGVDLRGQQHAGRNQALPHCFASDLSFQQKRASSGPRGGPTNPQPGFSGSPRPAASPSISSGRSVSNLERFLECTTPTMLSQTLPQRGMPVARHFFSLSDLWDSFDEWSAYGAGVPIVLNGKETVIQYYVPYLSAIQLYTAPKSCPFSKSRRLGDDSDCSDCDFRDTSSDGASSDGEIDTFSNSRMPVWRVSQGMSRKSTISCIPNYRFDRFPMEDVVKWQDRRPDNLLFEYFETAAPSIRVPLFDKITKLSEGSPALKTMLSTDLLWPSWLSVAWYPIYRIPTGPTLKDLAACFLTYHSLSNPLQEGPQLQPSACLESSPRIVLKPFGLASYKFRGAIWTSGVMPERLHPTFLQRTADTWLKQLQVQHPDYEYFISHTTSLRR